MIRLYVCGALRLRTDDGGELHSLLAQPKQTAVLAYLAITSERGFQRRDTLLALFWPELDSDHARSALSKSVHNLRRELGDDLLVSRGDSELAVAQNHLWCDATAIDAATAAGRPEEALELYRGVLLDGFHLSNALAFDQWLERQRSRFRDGMARAALGLAETAAARSDHRATIRWARRATEIAPYDEVALRLLVTALARGGDRAGALKAYSEFANLLASELDAEPSAETAAVERAVRAASPSSVAGPAFDANQGAAARVPESPPVAQRAVAVTKTAISTTRWLAAAALITAVAIIAAAVVRWNGAPANVPARLATDAAALCPDGTPAPCAPLPESPPALSIAVLDFDNRSRDTADVFLTDGLADEIATRLGQIDRFIIRSRAQVRRLRNATTLPIPELGRSLNVAYLVAGSVQRAGTRLRVNIQVLRAADGRQLFAELYDRDREGLLDVQTAVAAAVAGVVSGHLPPSEQALLASRPTQNRSAYEHYVRGNQHFVLRAAVPHALPAVEEYRVAVRLDSSFADAWAALARAEFNVFRGSFDVAVAHDSLGRLALARAQRLVPASAATIIAATDIGARDERSLRVMRDLVKRFPTNVDMILTLAGFELGQNLGNAIALAERAAVVDDRDIRGTRSLLNWYTFDHRYGLAARYAGRLIAQDPAGPDAYLVRAMITMMSTGDTAAIHADVLRAIDRFVGGSLIDAPNWVVYPLMRFDSTLMAQVDRLPPSLLLEYYWMKMRRAQAIKRTGVARAYADTFLLAARGSRSMNGQHGGEFWLADALAVLGRQAEIDASKWNPQLVDPTRYFYEYERARLFAEVGRFDEALDILEKQIARPSIVSPTMLRMDPGIARLRGQPRFERLIASAR